jgi:VIT1/CCC1 family predicted Fe2+/Mn2+ transporter
METLDQAKPNDIASQLLEQVYAVRKTQFSSSSNQVREAVQGRLDQEERMARNLMDSIIA